MDKHVSAVRKSDQEEQGIRFPSEDCDGKPRIPKANPRGFNCLPEEPDIVTEDGWKENATLQAHSDLGIIALP